MTIEETKNLIDEFAERGYINDPEYRKRELDVLAVWSPIKEFDVDWFRCSECDYEDVRIHPVPLHTPWQCPKCFKMSFYIKESDE